MQYRVMKIKQYLIGKQSQQRINPHSINNVVY